MPIEARGVRSLGDGVTGSCVQPDLGFEIRLGYSGTGVCDLNR